MFVFDLISSSGRIQKKEVSKILLILPVDGFIACDHETICQTVMVVVTATFPLIALE